MARLEHVNVTVADPDGTAEMLCRVFGWRRRWQGAAMTTGRTIHVGNDDSYVALFSYGDAVASKAETYRTRGGLNHIAVVVDDLVDSGVTMQKVVHHLREPRRVHAL